MSVQGPRIHSSSPSFKVTFRFYKPWPFVMNLDTFPFTSSLSVPQYTGPFVLLLNIWKLLSQGLCLECSTLDTHPAITVLAHMSTLTNLLRTTSGPSLASSTSYFPHLTYNLLFYSVANVLIYFC